MEKTLVTTQETKEVVCDVCGESASLIKCALCGKEVCAYCRAMVHFFQKEEIRGYTIPFVYDRVICQSHLPLGIDAPIRE